MLKTKAATSPPREGEPAGTNKAEIRPEEHSENVENSVEKLCAMKYS